MSIGIAKHTVKNNLYPSWICVVAGILQHWFSNWGLGTKGQFGGPRLEIVWEPLSYSTRKERERKRERERNNEIANSGHKVSYEMFSHTHLWDRDIGEDMKQRAH